jgi:hypothetical protein
MPIRRSKDSKGHFYQWGNSTKHYFNPIVEGSQERAYHRVTQQVKAIYSQGYKGK